MEPSRSPVEHSAHLQHKRLRTFLLGLAILTGAFGLLWLLLALRVPHWPFAIIGIASWIAGVVALYGVRLARRNRSKDAANWVGYGILFTTAFVSPFAPFGTGTIILVPILGVTVVLPYLYGRELLVFLCVAFADIMWIVASATWRQTLPPLAGSLSQRLDLVGTTAPAFVLLFLLWQHADQLRSTLNAEMRARRRAEQAHRNAEEAIRVRDEFLSIASHELRTPLMSLRLAVQAILGEKVTSADEIARALTLVDRQVEKLRQLVDEMLEAGCLQLGRLDLHLETIDLAEVVSRVVDRFRLELGRARTQVELNVEPVEGRWDSEKLDQVATNLLSNAIKFGRGRTIQLSVEARADDAVLTVTDQGIGIAPESLPQLFQKFERAVSARSYGGMGLGLFITRQSVEALGGEVWAESAGLGEGASFVVRLPTTGPPDRSQATEDEAPAQAKTTAAGSR